MKILKKTLIVIALINSSLVMSANANSSFNWEVLTIHNNLTQVVETATKEEGKGDSPNLNYMTFLACTKYYDNVFANVVNTRPKKQSEHCVDLIKPLVINIY